MAFSKNNAIKVYAGDSNISSGTMAPKRIMSSISSIVEWFIVIPKDMVLFEKTTPNKKVVKGHTSDDIMADIVAMVSNKKRRTIVTYTKNEIVIGIPVDSAR